MSDSSNRSSSEHDGERADRPSPATARVKSWRRHRVNMLFASQPQLFCGCLCLAFEDAQRLRRVFRIVRAITRGPRRPGMAAVFPGSPGWQSRQGWPKTRGLEAGPALKSTIAQPQTMSPGQVPAMAETLTAEGPAAVAAKVEGVGAQPQTRAAVAQDRAPGVVPSAESAADAAPEPLDEAPASISASRSAQKHQTDEKTVSAGRPGRFSSFKAYRDWLAGWTP